MENTIKSDIKPFKMHGNIYFVGSTRVSVHIIETEEGLVLLDTGYPDMYEQILDSMHALGFKPEDICAIFHSHGHIDHYGCTQRFKELSGAKTYISRIDNEIVNGTYNLSWAEELGYEIIPPFNCDVLIEDGDVFTFGSTKIRTRLTPGHTDGTMSFFIDIKDGDKTIVAAMHGGIGMNSMTAEFLKSKGLSLDARKVFREGLHALKDEHVDLFLGNHPQQNKTEEKMEAVLLRNESVLDSTEWNKFLIWIEEVLDGMLESEKEKA